MESIQADPFWHDFFYTKLTAGLRRGEICGYEWQDLESQTGTLQSLLNISPYGSALLLARPAHSGELKPAVLPADGVRDLMVSQHPVHRLQAKAM